MLLCVKNHTVYLQLADCRCRKFTKIKESKIGYHKVIINDYLFNFTWVLRDDFDKRVVVLLLSHVVDLIVVLEDLLVRNDLIFEVLWLNESSEVSKLSLGHSASSVKCVFVRFLPFTELLLVLLDLAASFSLSVEADDSSFMFGFDRGEVIFLDVCVVAHRVILVHLVLRDCKFKSHLLRNHLIQRV